MTYMLLLNCALKLVEEIILYYDARSKNHQVTWQFSGLQVIHNTMQYKCTIGGVAVQQYVVVHCDIDS